MTSRRTFGRALDTVDAATDVQVARWREMTPHQKAELVTALSSATRELAVAGIRARYPHASARERFLRLAILELGRDLAIRAYPDAASLTP